MSQAQNGAKILKRYKHPDSWKDGSSTGKAHLARKTVLKVEEIRLGGGAFVSRSEAVGNAKAIRAWAGSVGLSPAKFTIDQREGYAPYVVVDNDYFKSHVLPKLAKL